MIVFLSAFLFQAYLKAEDDPIFSSAMFPCSYLLRVGPEVYYFQRSRDGGTEQSGRMEGVRVWADRVKGAGFYAGGEFLYSNGFIKGCNARGRKLRSEVTDIIGEGRVGFTFMIPFGRFPFIIPYVGYGYFNEKNQFLAPSPLVYQTIESFQYVAAGFLSGLNLTPQFSMGINIKARFMVNGRTGAVKGERPYSWVKIMLLVLAILGGIAAIAALAN